ncbi:hypothetical protein Peur_073948 [Populus x canadensis]
MISSERGEERMQKTGEDALVELSASSAETESRAILSSFELHYSSLSPDKNFSNCKKMTALGVEFGWEVNKHNQSMFPSMKSDCVTAVDYLTLHAALALPSMYNVSRLNHVWQVGYEVQGTEPKMHPTALQNVDSTETIDLKTGWAQHVGEQERHLRTVHAILNLVGWGTFFPAGHAPRYYSFKTHRLFGKLIFIPRSQHCKKASQVERENNANDYFFPESREAIMLLQSSYLHLPQRKVREPQDWAGNLNDGSGEAILLRLELR